MRKTCVVGHNFRTCFSWCILYGGDTYIFSIFIFAQSMLDLSYCLRLVNIAVLLLLVCLYFLFV